MLNVEELQLEISHLEQETLELKAKNAYYEEQLKLMMKRKYGSSSEKVSKGQISMFYDMLNEAESQSNANAEEPTLEKITYEKMKRSKDSVIAKFIT